MKVKQLLDLSGKTALITGGSRGLGLQMAEAVGEMGARVAITARKAGELEEAKAHLKGMGIDVLTVVNDQGQVSSPLAFDERQKALLETLDYAAAGRSLYGGPFKDSTLKDAVARWTTMPALMSVLTSFVAVRKSG